MKEFRPHPRLTEWKLAFFQHHQVNDIHMKLKKHYPDSSTCPWIKVPIGHPPGHQNGSRWYRWPSPSSIPPSWLRIHPPKSECSVKRTISLPKVDHSSVKGKGLSILSAGHLTLDQLHGPISLRDLTSTSQIINPQRVLSSSRHTK